VVQTQRKLNGSQNNNMLLSQSKQTSQLINRYQTQSSDLNNFL
jgi:hypothetical protein